MSYLKYKTIWRVFLFMKIFFTQIRVFYYMKYLYLYIDTYNYNRFIKTYKNLSPYNFLLKFNLFHYIWKENVQIAKKNHLETKPNQIPLKTDLNKMNCWPRKKKAAIRPTSPHADVMENDSKGNVPPSLTTCIIFRNDLCMQGVCEGWVVSG